VDKPLGVAARAIVRREGKILLLQRSGNSSLDLGLWELPGGKIRYGEELETALKREVAEETGLTIEVGRPFATWHFLKEPFWVTGVTFVCDYVDGEVTLSSEHSAFAWIGPDEYEHCPPGSSEARQIRSYFGLISHQ
jgi:8-oxo-dGTP diphosphatase